LRQSLKETNMAWTQTDLDRIKQAIATGASRVSLPSSGSVEYRGLGDMLRIKGEIERELATAAGKSSPPRIVKIIATKGL
jgi:hypothetical protein